MKSMRKSILYNFFIQDFAILVRNTWHISNHPQLFLKYAKNIKCL